MICHVDMDAFFASVEQVDDPSCAGKCVIVGGVSDRSVVAAASYEARAFGVRSAMPVYRARQLCPDAVFLPPRKERYKQVSERVMEVLHGFSPIVEQVSIDEAFLDLTGCERLFGSHGSTGEQIRKRIREKTGLNCSVGMAPLKFLAKIASDMHKPNGLRVITQREVPAVIDRLPVSRVPGVGPVGEKYLDRLNIRFLGEVRAMQEEDLVKHLGRFGRRLHALSHGVDRAAVTPVRPVQSVSSEETLENDTMDIFVLETLLLKHAEMVGRRIRKMKLLAGTVFIKLKDRDFQQITRQSALSVPSHASGRIYQAGCGLLRGHKIRKPVRLAGIGVCDLIGADVPVQRTLFEGSGDGNQKWDRLDQAVDVIADRFGPFAIRKARLVRPD